MSFLTKSVTKMPATEQACFAGVRGAGGREAQDKLKKKLNVYEKTYTGFVRSGENLETAWVSIERKRLIRPCSPHTTEHHSALKKEGATRTPPARRGLRGVALRDKDSRRTSTAWLRFRDILDEVT